MMRMPFHRTMLIAAGCLLLSFGAQAKAEEVTLTPLDGGTPITGEMISANSQIIIIKSPSSGMVSFETSKYSCAGQACPQTTPAVKFGIHGGNMSAGQLMPFIIERFAAQEGYSIEKIEGSKLEEIQYRLTTADGKQVATIDVQSHGSSTAVTGLLNGKAQIGAMGRPMSPEEVKSITGAGAKMKVNIFALDGMLVVVSPQNPVKALSVDQIAQIFSGDIKDWSQVGGKPGAIKVYSRDAKSGTFDMFDTLVLKPKKLKLTADAKRFESGTDLSDEVARDPNGIGFVGFAHLRNTKPVSITTACGIVSPADIFSIKTEDYPLTRRHYFYSLETLPAIAQKLLEFASSDAIQKQVSEIGFIDQNIEIEKFEKQAVWFTRTVVNPDKNMSLTQVRNLANAVTNMRRASVDFRFHTNSALLDDKALQDVPRLARFVKGENGKTKSVLLIGFADNAGTFEANKALSYSRAQTVKKALIEAGVPAASITVQAFGSLVPVACNTTDAGRQTNRRVEVWIKE